MFQPATSSSIQDRPLSGIIPPVVTPLTKSRDLDADGLERVVKHLVEAGVHGFFVLGTTGEGPALSVEVSRAVVTETVRLAAGRVPVLVGVTASALPAAVELATHAAEEGALAAVVAPAPYYPVSEPELIAYFDAVAEQMPLPVVPYNIPSRTQGMSLNTVARLMEHERFIGFKDSGGDMVYLHKIIAARNTRRPDWSVMVGPEELLAESVLLGADGGVAGGSNLFPRLYVELYNAAAADDLRRVRELHAVVIELMTTFYMSGRHGSSFMKSLKAGLEVAGLCGDTLAEPYQAFYPSDKVAIAEKYRQALALVDACLSTAGAVS